MLKSVLFFLQVLLCSLLLSDAQADDAHFLNAVQNRFPYQKILAIRSAPIKGFYEVDFSDHVAYIDESLNFMIAGDIYSLANMRDLTDARRHELYGSAFDKLPLDLAIRRVKGNGKAKLAVFTDPQCPYCRKFEHTLAGMNNITIYTFMVPLLPGSEAIAKAIWCQTDRQRAWEDQLLRNHAPDHPGLCDTSGLNRIAALASQLGVRVTPTLMFANGQIHPGLLDQATLETEMSDNQPSTPRGSTN